MECPSCHAPVADGAADCPGCGVIFAKWVKVHAEGQAPAEPSNAKPGEAVSAMLKDMAEGRFSRLDASKLQDTGGWGYVSDWTSQCNGIVFIDCTHGSDLFKTPWYAK